MRESDEPPNREHTAPLDTQDPGLDLEFPDAPDFVSERTQYPLDRVLAWLEEMRAMFPMTDRQREMREEVRCTEEFIL